MMNQSKLQDLLKVCTIEWSKHTLQRMLERDIRRVEVKEALSKVEIIEEYKDDKPYPSYLIYYVKDKYLHTVISLDEINSIVYIITTYRPDLKYFEQDYKTRRKK